MDKVKEIIGTIPEELTNKVAYWGLEPSGRLHEGHLIPFNVLTELNKKGAATIVWVADLHAKLNGKEVTNDWEVLKTLYPHHSYFVQSKWMEAHGYEMLSLMLTLSEKVTVNRAVRCIDCAGRKEDDNIKMSWLNYALMQACDIKYLDVDIVVGGMEQRKVHMLARDEFKRLKWKVPTMIHTELLLDATGQKMSKSRPEYCKFI